MELTKVLTDYQRTYRAKGSPNDKLIAEIGKVDLSAYVKNLSSEQLAGKKPLFSILDEEEGFPSERLDLYWNPAKANIQLEWDNDYRKRARTPIIEVVLKRTKPLAKITPADIPRGLTAEDVATDVD